MTKYVFYLVQSVYCAFFFIVKPLEGYVFSAGTAITMALCGSMILTELVNSWSLRALSESFKRHVVYLALGAGIMVVATLWQINTSHPLASLGFCAGIFGLDVLSMFFLMLYMMFRGALLVHFVSGGSEKSRLKPDTVSPRRTFVWAAGIALLLNMSNLFYMLVLSTFAAV